MADLKVTVLEGASLEEFKRSLEKQLYGDTPPACCVSCKEPFSDKNVRTALGWKETKISKLCENCWDAMLAPSDDPEDLGEEEDHE